MGGTVQNLKSSVKCARYFWMPYPKELCEKYNVESIQLSLYVSNWVTKAFRDSYCDKLIDVCEKYKKGECEWSHVMYIFIMVADKTKSKLVRETIRKNRHSRYTMQNYFQ